MSERPSFEELLGQREVWWPRDSKSGELVEVKLADMHYRHLMALRSMLLSRAEGMHRAHITRLHNALLFTSGDQAEFELGRELDRLEEMTARQWMREQPLVEAIEEILRNRFPTPGGPGLPRQLTGNDRHNLAEKMRIIGYRLDDDACELAAGDGTLNVVQWNAHVDLMVERVKDLRIREDQA